MPGTRLRRKSPRPWSAAIITPAAALSQAHLRTPKAAAVACILLSILLPARSIETMEMMQRTMPMSDTDAIGRGDRGCDPRFRAAHGHFERLAFGKVSCDRR